MPLAISIGIIVVLLFVLWIAFGLEPGPGPADVAIAYENAWDRLDFELLYDLSGDELRDGMNRATFVSSKLAAYSQEHARLGAKVTVEDVVATGQTAVVVTRVMSPDGSVQNRVLLEKRANGWQVIGYSVRAA